MSQVTSLPQNVGESFSDIQNSIQVMMESAIDGDYAGALTLFENLRQEVTDLEHKLVMKFSESGLTSSE